MMLFDSLGDKLPKKIGRDDAAKVIAVLGVVTVSVSIVLVAILRFASNLIVATL